MITVIIGCLIGGVVVSWWLIWNIWLCSWILSHAFRKVHQYCQMVFLNRLMVVLMISMILEMVSVFTFLMGSSSSRWVQEVSTSPFKMSGCWSGWFRSVWMIGSQFGKFGSI